MTNLEVSFRRDLADRYEIDRELGRGGMATVYLALDLKHHRRVAIKVLRREWAASIGVERFVQEIDIAAKLTHPNILPLHDSGAAGGFPYYVMPYVEGESLRARLDREGQLPVEEAVRIGEEVADALDYAHDRGVIHRDIKPENILLEAGHAVLADFGIARALIEAGGTRLTETGYAVGTPTYMSPEQAAGARDVDQRTDIYSLGCVLYEMLGGEAPHHGPTPQAILARVLTEPARSLTGLRPAIPPALDQAVLKALARAPGERFPTAAELKAALRSATGISVPVARPSRVGWRRSLAVVGIVSAAALAVLVGRAVWPRTAPADDRLGLALFPLQASGPTVDDWSEQLPDLLATVLDGTPGVRVADPWSLWGGLRPERGARAKSPADVDDATRLARRAKAGLFLLGSVRAGEGPDAAGGLAVTLRLYRVGTREAQHTVTQSGSVDSVGALVQRLAVDLITRLKPAGRVAVPELEGFSSRSAAAIKGYLRAKEAMRRGRVDAAEAAIDSALAADSTFALGLLEAVKIKSWALSMRGRQFAGFQSLVEQAVRFSDSLTPRNRLRLEATRASVQTDGPAAARAARAILALDSTDVDAWNSLAYYHRVYGWQYGSREEDAVEALDRAIALDSTHVPSLVGLLSLLDQMGDPRANRTESLLRRTDTVSVLARGALLGHRAVVLADSDFVSFADTLATQNPLLLTPVLRSLRSLRPERAAAVLTRLLPRQGPGITDYRPEWARFLAAQGRYRALDSAIQAGGFPMQTLPRWFLVAPFLADVGDSARAGSAVRFLEPFIPADSALAWLQKMPVWLNGWTVGAYHAMYGDSTVTRRWQAAIGTLPAARGVGDYRGSLQADLEARLLARRGDQAGALAAAARAYQLWAIHTENVPEYNPEPGMRFHYAMLLLAAGKRDSATALLRSMVPPTTWMGFLTARASLELGRLAEDRRDRSEAARHYGMAYRLWRPADPEVAQWRDAARDGLRRVTGEPPAP